MMTTDQIVAGLEEYSNHNIVGFNLIGGALHYLCEILDDPAKGHSCVIMLEGVNVVDSYIQLHNWTKLFPKSKSATLDGGGALVFGDDEFYQWVNQAILKLGRSNSKLVMDEGKVDKLNKLLLS